MIPRISRALKLIRTYHNLKQKDLADRLDISPSHLSEIESGTKPVSYELLEKYAAQFKMPVSSITLFAEDPRGNASPAFQALVAEKAVKLLEWIESISEVNKPDARRRLRPH